MRTSDLTLGAIWLVVAGFLRLAALGRFGLDPDAGLALAVGAAAKTGMITAAAITASLAARRMVQRDWYLLATGFWLFAGAQAYLGLSQFASGEGLAFPTPADFLFLAGYGFFMFALAGFLGQLSRAGLLIGFERRLPYVVAGVLGLGAIAGLLIFPYLKNLLLDLTTGLLLFYPLLDLALMVPVILLCGATWPFRGGAAWITWSSLFAGFTTFLIGDLYFAVMLEQPAAWVGWVVDCAYLGSYCLFTRATYRQWQLTR